MFQGRLPVTWTVEDYQNLNWFSPDHIEERFTATIETNLYNNVNVYICNDNLPQILYDCVRPLNLEKCVTVVNRMMPGQILPYHRDKYATYKKRNNISDDQEVTRIIVFLHEQKAGHQLWIEDQFCSGPAGSYFGWTGDTVHMAANLGSEDRYILQVTGLQK